MAVVVPLYNKRRTVRRALDSVLAQTCPPSEVVVVDDGSSDGSADIVSAEYGDAVRLIRQPNGGPGQARNVGAATSRASLLAFLDADDAWRPGYLAAATAMLAATPESVAYACGYDSGAFSTERPNKVAAIVSEPTVELLDPAIDGPAFKIRVDALHSSCTVVRRSVFERLGGFYAADRCLYGEDSWLWIGVLTAGPVCWDPAAHVRFHVEDSDIGYARGRNVPLPPVLTATDALRARCPQRYRPCVEALVAHYMAIKIGDLFELDDLRGIASLRALHGQDTPGRRLRDGVYWLRRKVGRRGW